MRALLDVNVLIALFDQDHPASDKVADWFQANAEYGWATCAITENGFVRILSQAGYQHPIRVRGALALLAGACNQPIHEFWPCEVSITDPGWVDPSYALTSAQVTDLSTWCI